MVKDDLDYETKNSYTVTVTAIDPSTCQTITVPVTINVEDLDDPAETSRGSSTTVYADNGTASVASFDATRPGRGCHSVVSRRR